MGAELRLIITGFKLKLSSVLLLTALSNHFLLLLPLLSLVPLHLLFLTVTSTISFTLQFSQISPCFFPVSAHSYYWHHLCSASAPVLYNTAHSYSLCPLNVPLSIRCPHNPLSPSGNVSRSSRHQPAEIKCRFCCLVKNQVPDHPSRKEKLFTLLLAAEAGSSQRGAIFQDHQQSSHSDTLTLSLQHQKKQTLAFTHTPCRFWGEN